MLSSSWGSDVCSSDLTLSWPQARDLRGWCIARPQVQRDEDAIGQIERPQTAPLETAATVKRRADRAAVRDDEGGDRLQFGKGARYACDARRPPFAARRRVGVGVAPETVHRLSVARGCRPGVPRAQDAFETAAQERERPAR